MQTEHRRHVRRAGRAKHRHGRAVSDIAHLETDLFWNARLVRMGKDDVHALQTQMRP